jgi:hypothetical protein
MFKGRIETNENQRRAGELMTLLDEPYSCGRVQEVELSVSVQLSLLQLREPGAWSRLSRVQAGWSDCMYFSLSFFFSFAQLEFPRTPLYL